MSNTSSLIIYLKCQSEKNGEPHFMFLDLIELENQSAKAIFEALVKCLDSYGFIDDYLKNILLDLQVMEPVSCSGESLVL